MKQEKIDVILQPVSRFIKDESTAGILLFVSALIALIWANSPLHSSYHALWHVHFSIGFGDFQISKDLHHWINDGLMAIFFFVIGLELKREFIGGELSSMKKAILPLAAGAGGMLIPAGIYLFINSGTAAVDGWGIPMATDIAFALGILALLGKRVPVSLKVFLTALAIADDLGAVLVIALFYTSDISMISVGVAALILLVMLVANLLGVRNAVFYGILGIGGLWLAFLMSGLHATIAGVLAALAIPARTKIGEEGFVQKLKHLTAEFMRARPNDNDLLTHEQLHIVGEIKAYSSAAETPLQRLEHVMHPLVAFGVMPVFALANAGVTFQGITFSDLFNPVSVGIILGLVVGKFVGITAISGIMVKTGVATLPENARWKHVYGVALLAGVGFTMSLFITELAFSDPDNIQYSKIGILIASLIAGLGGYVVLRKTGKLDVEAVSKE